MVMSVGVLDGLELQSGTRRDARSWSSSDLGLHDGAVVVLQQQQQQGVREEMVAAEDEAEEQQCEVGLAGGGATGTAVDEVETLDPRARAGDG